MIRCWLCPSDDEQVRKGLAVFGRPDFLQKRRNFDAGEKFCSVSDRFNKNKTKIITLPVHAGYDVGVTFTYYIGFQEARNLTR